MPIPVGLRLFPPDEWPSDAAHAGVPVAAIAPRSKGEIALAELDWLLAAGMRFGAVLADAGYGTSVAFRQGLEMRHLRWAVGIARNQKIYGVSVQFVPPRGRARCLVPDEEPRAADEVLAVLPWPYVTWRHSTKGSLAMRFAAVRVRGGQCPRVGQQSPPAGQGGLAGRRVAHEWRAQVPTAFEPRCVS